MIVEFFAAMFHLIKWLFGLGALGALLGLVGLVLWFSVHIVVRYGLRRQPADRARLLRTLFLEDA